MMPGKPPPTGSPVTRADWGGRGTRAEIDLDALAGNVRAIQTVAPGSELLAVVKANGYGHGAAEVARTALAHGASRLGVYTVEEGVLLRKAGIEAPVLLFGPFLPVEARRIVESGLTPSVNSIESAEWLAAARPSAPVKYHVKIDTGLTRQGALPEHAVDLLRRLSEFDMLTPEGLYTHFARADEPECDETMKQFKVFKATARALADAGFVFPLEHVANSGATLRSPETHLDMVRCGISLYGYDPSPTAGPVVKLRPVLALHSYVARLTIAKPSTGVGYGHKFKCFRTSRIALVPAGYADGVARALGCGVGEVLVAGRRAPIVGRVSMDQLTVDVTDIPEVGLGDTVTIIGAQGDDRITADDVAENLDTISYELLAGIMPRVPRIYVKKGHIAAVKGLAG